MIPHSGRALLLRCGPGATLGSWKRKGFNFVLVASGAMTL